ncbi:MAG: HIT domain-containing protein [Candidatus Nanopelagicales bacterium]
MRTDDLGDRWERLWTPHRMAYLNGESRPAHDEAGEECPFCRAPGQPDSTSLIVHRGEFVYAVLNLYPYNSGHLLICPYRHVPHYDDLTEAEVLEMGVFTQTSMRALRHCARAHGFNIGMNQGAVGGAGIAGHLHQHVVPRWGGDTNFMPIIGRTKTMAQLLDQTRELLVEAWSVDDADEAIE